MPSCRHAHVHGTYTHSRLRAFVHSAVAGLVATLCATLTVAHEGAVTKARSWCAKLGHLGALALEQSIHQLEGPLQAARLDVGIRGQRLLQLVHLACWQGGRSTGLLQKHMQR